MGSPLPTRARPAAAATLSFGGARLIPERRLSAPAAPPLHLRMRCGGAVGRREPCSGLVRRGSDLVSLAAKEDSDTSGSQRPTPYRCRSISRYRGGCSRPGQGSRHEHDYRWRETSRVTSDEVEGCTDVSRGNAKTGSALAHAGRATSPSSRMGQQDVRLGAGAAHDAGSSGSAYRHLRPLHVAAPSRLLSSRLQSRAVIHFRWSYGPLPHRALYSDERSSYSVDVRSSRGRHTCSAGMAAARRGHAVTQDSGLQGCFEEEGGRDRLHAPVVPRESHTGRCKNETLRQRREIAEISASDSLSLHGSKCRDQRRFYQLLRSTVPLHLPPRSTENEGVQ